MKRRTICHDFMASISIWVLLCIYNATIISFLKNTFDCLAIHHQVRYKYTCSFFAKISYTNITYPFQLWHSQQSRGKKTTRYRLNVRVEVSTKSKNYWCCCCCVISRMKIESQLNVHTNRSKEKKTHINSYKG